MAAVLEQLDLGDKGSLPPMGRWSLVKVLGLGATAVVSGVLAAMRLLNTTADDDFAGTMLAIFGVLAAVAFPSVLMQYLKARRRRSA